MNDSNGTPPKAPHGAPGDDGDDGWHPSEAPKRPRTSGNRGGSPTGAARPAVNVAKSGPAKAGPSKSGPAKGGAKRAPRGGASKSRAKQPKRVKRHSLAFRIVRGVIVAVASLFLLAMLGFIALYLLIDIPKANAQAQQSVSVVYYADGKTEMGRFQATNREPVKLSEVPLATQHAFVAAEDRSFYSNRGISPKGIARAFLHNFSGDSGSQGGSTLTQQYVKNYFLTQDRTLSRKVKELIISLKIDQEQSKDTILQNYLNNVYFGRGTYGIQAAAKSYFHKDVSKLTSVEGAFLATVVNNPENMDPTAGPNSEQRVNARMAYVLNGMVTLGWLSQADRKAAVMPTFYKRQAVKYADGPEGYIINSVRAELARKLDFGQEDLDRGGLRITTTIDKRAQDAASAAVDRYTPSTLLGKLHTGLVAEKANDGAIVAMYGGADYDPVKAASSDADQSILQAASSMKLYTAVAAMQQGKSVATRYNGLSPTYFGTTKVTNDHNESYGRQPLSNMLAYSINTAFVNLNKQIGPEATIKAAEASGYPETYLKDKSNVNILNTLGYSSTRVVDQATGYNTLNSGGKYYDRYLISKVRSFDDSFSYDVKKTPKEAYAKGIADDLTWALNKTGVYGTAAGVQNELGRVMASKTGTATGNKYIWFNGFTPGQLTTSVGMYYSTDGKTALPMQDLPGVSSTDIYGAGLPRKVWVAFMQAALEGQKATPLPARSYYNMDKPEESQPAPSTTYVPPTAAEQQPQYPQPTAPSIQPTQPEPGVTDAPEPRASQTGGDTIPQQSTAAPTSAPATVRRADGATSTSGP